MASAVLANPAATRPKFLALIAEGLRHAKRGREHLLVLAWVCELRELRDMVANIATSGPKDFGTRDLNESDSTLKGYRMHLARKIATLWDESDLVTRLQLESAMAPEAIRALSGGNLMRARLRRDFANGMEALSLAQRERVRHRFDEFAALWLADFGREPWTLRLVEDLRAMLVTPKK